MISFIKWKRQIIFILLGVVPLLLFMLFFFFTIKYYTLPPEILPGLENYKFMYLDLMNVFIAIVAAAITIVILIIVGNRLLRHAFISMLEGKGIITLILDSTGVIGSFISKVNAPKMTGELLPNEIEDIYDTDMQHRLMVPRDAPMTQGTFFDKDENGNITLGETVDVLVIPKGQEKYDNLFMFENRPVFIFNKVMNKYLSRDALAKFEKDIEIKHNALNILRKIQETDTSFRDFGRYVGEKIRPQKKQGIFGSPIVKYIVIAAIIILIIILLASFVPGILNAGSGLKL